MFTASQAQSAKYYKYKICWWQSDASYLYLAYHVCVCLRDSSLEQTLACVVEAAATYSSPVYFPYIISPVAYKHPRSH